MNELERARRCVERSLSKSKVGIAVICFGSLAEATIIELGKLYVVASSMEFPGALEFMAKHND